MIGLIISVTNKPSTKNNAVDKMIVGDVAKNIEPVVLKEDIPNSAVDKVKKENKGYNKKEFDKKTIAKEEQQKLQQQSALQTQPLLNLNQNYLVQVKQSLDSFKINVPQYQPAINTQVNITPELLQKAMSYQNFKHY